MLHEIDYAASELQEEKRELGNFEQLSYFSLLLLVDQNLNLNSLQWVLEFPEILVDVLHFHDHH